MVIIRSAGVSARRASLLAGAGTIALLLAACGGGSTEAAGSPAPAVTVTVTSSETTASPSVTPTAPDESEPLLEETPLEEDPTGPPVIRNVTTPRLLTLADIFDPKHWEEGVYQVPGSTTGQQAIGLALGCYQADLEVRLAEPTGKASVTVAQALDSKRSDVVLQFKLLANGRLVDTKKVRFDQSATLTAPLSGVSALVLEVEKAPGTEHCGATAVITRFEIAPA